MLRDWGNWRDWGLQNRELGGRRTERPGNQGPWDQSREGQQPLSPLSPAGEWQWVSDRPSLRAPCPDAVSYYCRYGRDPAFTEGGAGQRFGDLHARYLRLLAWPGEPHEELSLRDGQGECYHLLLPSFYRLLDALHRDGRAFAVVFRTFGTDLPRTLRALRCALDGQHPQFPALRDLEVSGTGRGSGGTGRGLVGLEGGLVKPPGCPSAS